MWKLSPHSTELKKPLERNSNKMINDNDEDYQSKTFSFDVDMVVTADLNAMKKLKTGKFE